MMRHHARPLAYSLGAAGLVLVAFKVLVLHFPVLPNTTTPVWTVEANVALQTTGKPVRASLILPTNGSRFLVTDERFSSRNFRLSTRTGEADRRATWSARNAVGRQNLTYGAVVRRTHIEPAPLVDAPVIPSPRLGGPSFEAAQAVVFQVRRDSGKARELVREVVTLVNSPTPNAVVRPLLGIRPTPAKRADVIADILAAAQVPARLVHGLELSHMAVDSSRAQQADIVEWLEIYDDGAWRPHNLRDGEQERPEHLLPWWYGSEPLMRVEGDASAQVSVSVTLRDEEATQSALVELAHRRPRLLDFSLFALPTATQSVYRVLLLIPMGALIVVALRNVVGIKTFGTFMPILLALAFRETRLLWGLLFFSVIVGLGIAIRAYLARLELLMVPRLASILVVLVMLMIAVSILAQQLGIEEGISVALFPMVIMTMTVERISTIWDELGGRAALTQALGSLIVAAATYGIINTRIVAHLTFVFPEVLLLILAACLLLGRYTGYRVLELPRFRAISEAVS